MFWDLHRVAYSLLPLAPGPRRKTIFEEVVPGSVWTMDQLQGVVNVNVPVRGVAVKLRAGGLLLYNPVAPTKEMINYIRGLEAAHGPVKHVVLGSLGLEHKALAGPATRFFPKAEIWVHPGQWSFPLDLPNFLFGFPLRVKEIPLDSNPWKDDFDIAVLPRLSFKSVGGFGETTMFHRDSKTCIVTDAVIRVPSEPPAIIAEDPRALLFHSRDGMTDPVSDTLDARRRGWRRMALFGLFFYPSGIKVEGVFDTLSKLKQLSKDVLLLGKGALPISPGLYPWSWRRTEEPNFKALQGGLLVAPILRKLILNREPDRVLRWVEKVSSWGFKRVIPAHFENNVPATGRDFQRAYAFLSESPGKRSKPVSGPAPLKEDYFLLDVLSDVFTKLSVVAPPQVVEG